MQDVSRVTGDPVILSPKSKEGREYIVRGAGFADIGALQAQMLHKRRKDKIDSAMLVAEVVTPHERQVILERARKEAEAIAYVSMEEMLEYVTTEEGVVTFLWCLLERQYKGEFTRSDVYEMLLAGDLGQEAIEKLVGSLVGTPQGNAIGRRANSQTTLASEDGGTPSGSLSHPRKLAAAAGRARKR